MEESNDAIAQKQAENEILRKEIASRDREVSSQKRVIGELCQKVKDTERELKQQRVVNARRETETSKMPQKEQLRARLEEEKAQVKRLEAEKDELARKWEADKLETERELEAVQQRVLWAQDRATDSKENRIDAERISADAVRALDEQTRLTEEARKEVAALHQELAATKERLRELSLHQSQGEDLQAPGDMSDDYQTQEGSDDSDMELDATEAAKKGRTSSEDSGAEQRKASAGGKEKRSQQSGRGAKPAAKKKQEEQAAEPAMTRAKVKLERAMRSSRKEAKADGEFETPKKTVKAKAKMGDEDAADPPDSGSRFHNLGTPEAFRSGLQ